MNQQEFIQWWTEAYLAQYGVKYSFQKKDFGHIKSCIDYFDGNIYKMQEGAIQYLQDKDDFVLSRRHELIDFLTKPHRWVRGKVEEKKEVAAEAKPERYRDHNKEFWDQHGGDPGTWEDQIAKDPVRFMKGFRQTGPSMKQWDSKRYEEIRQKILEVVGPQRATAMWNDANHQLWKDVRTEIKNT